MKKCLFCRRALAFLRICLAVCAGALPGPALAQTADLVNERTARLLYHPTYDHEDYARQGYRRTGRQVEERLTSLQYDEFGTLLMDGLQLYDLRQIHPMPDAVVTPAREPGSSLRKSLFYNDYLNRLFIASDSYGDHYFKVIIGDRIRTRFSPLILDQAMLNGFRIDSQVKDHQLSFIASRVDRPVFRFEGIFGYEQGYFGEVRAQPDLANSLLATYLLGGHYQKELGIFNLGLTYANQYRVDTQVGLAQNSLRGTLPTHSPRGIGPAARPSFVEYLVVKIADETPRDGGGARVYEVKLFINGQPREDLIPAITRHDTRVDEIIRTNRDLNGDRFFPTDRVIPPYVQFLGGSLPAETVGPEGFLEAEGAQYLLYWFAIPPDENHRVSFEALVSNDYTISLSEVYLADVTSNEPRQRNAATYFYRAISSPGKVVDGSNLRRVRFEYGRQTGVTVTGLRLNTQIKGLLVDAELVRNFDFRQYPDLGGRHHDTRSGAYYAVVQKDFEKLSVGGEYFDIPPEYSTSLSVQEVNFTNNYTGPFLSDIGNTFNTRFNNTMELDLVEDNDDRDPFPDDHFLSFLRDGDGIFPGLDADFDGRPDTNRNSNGIPDYREPFLLYYVDPDDYVYGDDFNNNGQIDVREDDDKPDYPYDRDLRGFHAFVGLRPSANLTVTLGRYGAGEPAGGGVTRTRYVKATYAREAPRWGRVEFIEFLRRVEDTIPNDTFRYGADRTFGALPVIPPQIRSQSFSERDLLGVTTSFVADPLLFKDSIANTAFLDWRIARFHPLQVRGNLKYEANFQQQTADQEANRIATWTSVLAGEYTLERGQVELKPQVKFQFEKVDDDQGAVLPFSEAFFYPILTASYWITPKTALRAGAQGFPFLKSRYRDLQNGTLGYDSEDYLAMATTTADYNGYLLSFNVGYQLRHQRMEDRSRKSEDIDFALFFVRVITALRPSEGRGG